ncbi:MAG: molybdopterin molybdenumtransferase MoeA, partial [Candidimonas sp.]
HFKARLGIDADGRLQALILPGQESYRIAPYARANAWVIAPAGISQLAAGTLVDACGLSHLQGPQPAGADA